MSLKVLEKIANMLRKIDNWLAPTCAIIFSIFALLSLIMVGAMFTGQAEFKFSFIVISIACFLIGGSCIRQTIKLSTKAALEEFFLEMTMKKLELDLSERQRNIELEAARNME